MSNSEYHRLLKRQLKNYLSNWDNYPQIKPFLEAVSNAYYDFDKTIKHLEHILEVSSNELFKKNQLLIETNESLNLKIEERTKQIYEQNQELAQFAEETAAQRDIIEAKAIEIEKVNHKLLHSIQYAKRLQNLILPQEEQFKTIFPVSFVIYRPRDVISGDFYWLYKRRDKVIFGVIDCTGHGVPGAFISLLVNDMLRLIVEIKNILEPAEILSELHKEINRAFNQDTTYDSNGADAVICQFDQKARILRYAGARLPLVVIHHDRQGLSEILRGDPISLGGIHRHKDTQFDEKVLHLHGRVSLYLSSDGYFDQLGGSKGCKITINRYFDTLQRYAHLPMDEQMRCIEADFDNWKSSVGRQLDDVTVIGLEIVAS